VDALCARMVTHPHTLDVIVASNLFGDILTDIGSAISGSLGVAPGGNINPSARRRRCSNRFTARRPTSRARVCANTDRRHLGRRVDGRPLGETKTEARIQAAIESVLSDERVKTPDLGGKATTPICPRRSPALSALGSGRR
jgi:tartrate dehydrogenase/decarboxylase/D-malate dehydrogenase